MNHALPHILTLAKKLPASPEDVFSHWTDRTKLLRWSELRGCELDVRVGGWYRFEFPASPGEEDITVGQYRVVNRPDRLEFTWDGVSPCGPTGETYVALAFEKADGGCRLRLRHAFADKQSMIECRSGWEYWFGSLERFLRGPDAR